MPSFSISPEDRIRLRHMQEASLEIHAYSTINLDIVWSTSTEDIPPLTTQLEALLSG